mmetsp:Transcript_57915/g.92004  ORF Transcript_57915/g.92004 Transcript_57915/m.92004 type:complete len:331 (+) Transcript_57915:32-1024(+)
MSATTEQKEQRLGVHLQDLVESLQSQITDLESWLRCRHIKTTEEDKEELEQIGKRINSLESSVYSMDQVLAKEEESLVYIERMLECVSLHNNKLSHMTENLPAQLPVISTRYKQPSNALTALIQSTRSQSQCEPPHAEQHAMYDALPMHNNENVDHSNSSNHHQQRRKSAKTKRRKAASSSLDEDPRAIKRRRKTANSSDCQSREAAKEIPQIEIVGKDEFDAVPKYAKGRLTQSRLNDAINEFNHELMTKYKILHMNPSKMQKHQYDLHERYVKQESNETKHCHWLSVEDLKDAPSFSADATGKAIFNVMRHLKRVKMIGGRTPKYIVI